MYKILFERNPRLQKDWPCPVCLASCSTVEVVVETGNEHIGTQELAQCHSCRAWLSPGFHYFLLSKSALETLLEQAGLPYFFVIDTGDRLIAWASKVEFCAPDLELFHWDAYLDYLNDISKCADPHLRGGALYRLFKDSLNTGRHERVSSAFTRLEEILKKTYGMDLTFPNVADVLKTKQFLDCIDKYPAWLGATLFFGGIYVGNCLGDIRRKRLMPLLPA